MSDVQEDHSVPAGKGGLVSKYQGLTGAQLKDINAHDHCDGFEMSAREVAKFIDDAIQSEQSDPETRIWTDEYLRKMQEVSYHLHWHAANLDGK